MIEPASTRPSRARAGHPRAADPRRHPAFLRHVDEGGVPRADAHVTTIAADLYRTEDLRAAVRSFLDDGPGKAATFTGR